MFRPSNGTWYVFASSAGYSQFGFGSNGDIPVPGDYDGDAKTDYAVFHCSTGVWYTQQSSAGYNSFAFGQCGEVPAPGDYDGDGKTDYAVFSPSNGTWYVQRSGAGYESFGFGQVGDVSLPTLPAVEMIDFNNGGNQGGGGGGGTPSIYGPGDSTSVTFWYLGGAPSTTGYSTTAVLMLQPPTPPAPNPTIKWSTDSPSRLAIAPATDGTSVTLTSLGASAYQKGFDMHVTVTYNGKTSSPFPVFIDTPYTMTTSQPGQYCNGNGCGCAALGYLGYFGYVNSVNHGLET